MLADTPIEEQRDDLVLSTHRSRLDVEAVHRLLLDTFWAASMPRHVLDRAIENSICVGVTERGTQLGFARVITDLATFAYLTDVIVADEARGRGLGAWMVDAIMRHPDLQGLRRFALLTRNAQGLYEKFGFSVGCATSTYMERKGPAAPMPREP